MKAKHSTTAPGAAVVKQNNAPIFVTGAPRSGTTWSGAMLAARGAALYHEPFNPNKGYWPKSFPYARRGSRLQPAVDELVGRILRGECDRCRMLDPSRRLARWGFRPPSTRVLVKDPIACFLLRHLTEAHGFRAIVLFRHPAALASSYVRLGWPTSLFLRYFLDDEELMADYLAPFEPLLRKHSTEDGLAAAATMHSSIQHVLWRQSEASPVSVRLSHEQLCSDPLRTFKELFQTLDLPYDRSSAALHRRLTSSRSSGHGPHSVERNSSEMARDWMRRIDAGDLAMVRDIWASFGVPMYGDETDWRSDART